MKLYGILLRTLYSALTRAVDQLTDDYVSVLLIF